MTEPLFPLIQAESVSLAQVSEKTGIGIETLRVKGKAGLIPGAFQVSRNDGWRFKRRVIEAWWEALDGPPPKRRR